MFDRLYGVSHHIWSFCLSLVCLCSFLKCIFVVFICSLSLFIRSLFSHFFFYCVRVRRPYCSVCDTGYAKSADQDCVICEETSLVATQIYLIVGSSIFVVVALAFLKTFKVAVLAKFAVLFDGLVDDIKTKMKILMMFGQVSCFPLHYSDSFALPTFTTASTRQ